MTHRKLPRLLFFAIFFFKCSRGLQICEQLIANCEGDTCYKSIPCYHGDCNSSGKCECDPCWEGESCQDYVDNFLPEFTTSEETVIIADVWGPNVVYTALAYDDDLDPSCAGDTTVCDCAETRYTLEDSSDLVDKLFGIDDSTGDIYVRHPDRLEQGQIYNLTVTAKTKDGRMSPSPSAHLQLRIVIYNSRYDTAELLDQAALSLLGNDTAEDIFHSRKRRQAEGDAALTEFNVTLTSGEPEDMKVGRRVDYKLEIAVPKTDGVDLIVEVFTKDVGNEEYTPVLAIFNVQMESKDDGISFSDEDKPNVEMLLSDEINTAYDRAILTFGNVKNTNDLPARIYIQFSVTQIKNPKSNYGETYKVTTGAEFDEEKYIWVGQMDITVFDSQDEISIDVEVVGPEEIPLDSAGVYVIKTFCAVRSENFTFEVIGPDEKDLVSVGNLGVKDFDVNYDPVPQSIYFYNTTKEGSDETVIYTKATMNLGIMTNVGNYQSPRDEGNLIEVTFAIYALNYEENVDKTVTFTPTVTVGEKVLYETPQDVKLVARKDESASVTIRYKNASLVSQDAGVGDMAVYALWFNLTDSGFSDFVVEVDVEEFNGIPRLEACSARLWHYVGSFDIPYINTTFIDPEISDGKFLFKFHRIHVTDQRSPSIYNDTMIYIQLILKVSAVSANKPMESLEAQVKAGSQGSPDGDVTVLELEIADKMTDYKVPDMKVKSGVPWEELYLGGAIVLNITMLVPKGRGYPEVFVETSGESNPSLPAIHICKAELSEVGKNLPCLKIHQDEINEMQTKYSKTDPANRFLPDMASLMLGDVGALPVEGDNFATVSVVVSLPENASIDGIDIYPVSSGILVSRNTIWTAMANVTVKGGPPPNLEEPQHPEAIVEYKEDVKVPPGDFIEVEVWVDTKIQSISEVTVELEASTPDASLCSLKVKSFGKNLPCVDIDTKPSYDPHENALEGNKIGRIKFSALSNIGFRSEDVEDDRLKVVALVRVAPTCEASQVEVQWRVLFGGGQRANSITIQVDPAAESSYDPEENEAKTKSLAFKPAYGDKAISLGSPVVVDFDLSLEGGSMAPVKMEIKNVDAGNKFPYDVCLGGIWFRGKNYPCFSPLQLSGTFTSSSDSSGHNDTAVYDLGLVCNTFVTDEEEENKVTVRVALRPVDDGSLGIGDKFGIDGHVTVGTANEKIDTLQFTVQDTPDQIETEEKPKVKLVQDSYPIKIRERTWIPFNVTIPVGSLLKVTAEARGPVSLDRAVVTVYNLRLKTGGHNIPCPMLYPEPKVTLEKTTQTTQYDVVKAEIGYFTNLGLTHKMNRSQEGDDDLTIEVEVEMSDHPSTNHGETFMLQFIADVGETNINITQPLIVERDGQEKPDLDVNVMVESSNIYQSGENIDVTLTIFHKNESTAEPEDVIIRFYLPPYVEYGSVSFKNATVVGDVQFVAEYGSLDVKIPQFLFSDSVAISLTLLADPKKSRGFGKGEIQATTPYRVLCMQTFREEPSNNPSVKDRLINCAPIGHLAYSVNSEECYDALGLDRLEKCQFSASSAAKKDFGPQNVGKGVNKGWSPALRLGPQKPYLQVDFQRTTRISRVEFVQVEGKRKVTQYRLQYSHTGSIWENANEVTELTYTDGAVQDDLSIPVQARFVRIIIEEADKEDEDLKYIGLEMEMYGCYVADKPASATCPKTDPTWYSDDKSQYGRHFSVDTEKDIIYFCDLEYDMKNLVCFSSEDAGSTWRILPRNIGGLIGFDKESGMMYAFDKRKRAYVASEDGTKWTPVDGAEVNSTADKDTFSGSLYVPAYTSEDIQAMDAKEGKWEASFNGLMYDGNEDPKARWSRCCKTG